MPHNLIQIKISIWTRWPLITHVHKTTPKTGLFLQCFPNSMLASSTPLLSYPPKNHVSTTCVSAGPKTQDMTKCPKLPYTYLERVGMQNYSIWFLIFIFYMVFPYIFCVRKKRKIEKGEVSQRQPISSSPEKNSTFLTTKSSANAKEPTYLKCLNIRISIHHIP